MPTKAAPFFVSRCLPEPWRTGGEEQQSCNGAGGRADAQAGENSEARSAGQKVRLGMESGRTFCRFGAEAGEESPMGVQGLSFGLILRLIFFE